MLAAGWAEGGARTPPLRAGGDAARHGPGLALTLAPGCPDSPPGHAGNFVRIVRGGIQPKRRSAQQFKCDES